MLTPADFWRVITVEDWAEIRRLHRAEGVPIKEIADLLRHRDMNTARVYARVDLERLRSVALPWPGSGS